MKYLLLLTSFIFADSISIEPLTLSYHYDRDLDKNENHKYVGLRYQHENGFEAGVATMINSHYRRSNSVYIGFSDSFYNFTDGEIGAFGDIGYRTGYDRELLALAGLYAEYKNVYLKVAVAPNVTACTIGYKFNFEGL